MVSLKMEFCAWKRCVSSVANFRTAYHESQKKKKKKKKKNNNKKKKKKKKKTNKKKNEASILYLYVLWCQRHFFTFICVLGKIVVNIPRKCHKAQPSRCTKRRRDEEQIRTQQTQHRKPQIHKEELQQRG